VDTLETLVVVDNAPALSYTAAILRWLHQLGWPWRLFWVTWLIPVPIRVCALIDAPPATLSHLRQAGDLLSPAPEDAHRFIV
jgi:hypothetical protein